MKEEADYEPAVEAQPAVQPAEEAQPAVQPAEAQPAVQPAEAQPAVQLADLFAAKSPGVQASAVAAEGSATPQAEPIAKADLSEQQKSNVYATVTVAEQKKGITFPPPAAAADYTMDDTQAAHVKLADLDGLGILKKNHEMPKTTVYVAHNRVFLALQNARKALPKGVVQCFPGMGTITAANKDHPLAVPYAPVKRTQICVQGKLCTVEDNLSPTVQEVWERQFIKNNFAATPGPHGKPNEFYWAPKPHEEKNVAPFRACANLEVVFICAVRDWNGKPALQPVGIVFVMPQKLDWNGEARTIWCS